MILLAFLYLLLGGVLVAFPFLLKRTHRPLPLERIGRLVVQTGGIWVLLAGIEAFHSDPQTQLVLSRLQYPFMGATFVLFVLYVWVYTDPRRRFPPLKWVVAMAIPPAVASILVWTRLFWSEVSVHWVGGHPVVIKVYTPLFYLYFAYVTFLMLITLGRILYWHTLWGLGSRRSFWGLLLSAASPLAYGMLYVLHVPPFSFVDLTPLVFGILAVVVTWNLYAWQSRSIREVAWEDILREINEAILLVQRNGIILEGNVRFSQILGQSPRSYVGRLLEEVWPELAEALKDLETQPEVWIRRMVGGKERVYAVWASRFPEHTVIFLSDETEWLEQELREHERHARMERHQSTIRSLMQDPDLREGHTRHAFPRVVSRVGELLEAQLVEYCVHNGERPPTFLSSFFWKPDTGIHVDMRGEEREVNASYLQALESHRVLRYPEPSRHPLGRYFNDPGRYPSRATIVEIPIRSARGVQAVLRVFRHTRLEIDEEQFLREVGDLMAFAVVLEELRNTRDLLDHVLAEAPVGIGVITREGKLLRLNRVAREMVAAWGKVEDDRLLSLGGMDLEALFQTRRGEIHPTREVVLEYHLHRLGGEQNLWILMLQDRTEERRLFQELRRSERMAALGQMSAGITHDLNNWLTAVIGYTELLEPFLKDPEAREYHQEILRQARRMVDLVGKIMDFVRARPRQVSVINVCEELKRNLEVYRKMLTPRIKLTLSLPEQEDTCRAEVDPVALHQIMLNLLANARDAMEGAGKVDIRVSFERRSSRPGQPERDWVCVRVEDTGKGIPPEHLDRIFDPYFTTKPFQRGTGLGLAQVYGLVRNTGGWVEVESEVGKGTTFLLYFPRVVEETAKTSAGEGHLEGSRKKPYNTPESPTSEQDDRP